MSNQIYSRIIEFQKNMPTIKKGEVNPFYKSKYAPLDYIQKAIQKILAEAGLGYFQEATSEGLKTTLFDVDGNVKEFLYPANFTGKPQDIGSAMTYAKRYALTACLGLIIEGDDDDGEKTREQSDYQKNNKTTQKITTIQAKTPAIDPKIQIKNNAKILLEKLKNNEITDFEVLKKWALDNEKILGSDFTKEILEKILAKENKLVNIKPNLDPDEEAKLQSERFEEIEMERTKDK